MFIAMFVLIALELLVEQWSLANHVHGELVGPSHEA